MRDTLKFHIDVNTTSPITEMLIISKVFDGIHSHDLSSIEERQVLEFMVKYITFNVESFTTKDVIKEYLTYFNEEIVDGFIQQMTDDEFRGLEKKWQNER